MYFSNMDLNILTISDETDVPNDKNCVAKILTAFKLGYEVVALNTIMNGSDLTQAKGKELNIPEPLEVKLGEKEMSEALIGSKTFKVLSRLTVIVDDNFQCHKLMQSPVTKKYDLLAFQPTDIKIFQYLCGSLEFDLFSLDLTASHLPFPLKKNNIKQATDRGISFEIVYSPCISDSQLRRNIISHGNTLVEATRGKDIILSSSALRVLQLRSPHDVANLGNLFGMAQNQAVAAVNKNCKKVVIHSEVRRKTGFGVVSIQALEDVAPSEQWLKEACTYLSKLENETSELQSIPENSKTDDSKDKDDSPPEKRIKTN